MGFETKKSFKVYELSDEDFLRVQIDGAVHVIPYTFVRQALVQSRLFGASDEAPKQKSAPREAVLKDAPFLAHNLEKARAARNSRYNAILDNCRVEWMLLDRETSGANRSDIETTQALELYLRQQLGNFQENERVRVSSIIKKLDQQFKIPHQGYRDRLVDVFGEYLKDAAWGPRIRKAIHRFAKCHDLAIRPVRELNIERTQKGFRAGRSLASVSQVVSRYMKQSEVPDFDERSEASLIDALQDFNGIINVPITTKVWWELQELRHKRKLSDRLNHEIERFLDEFVELKSVG